MKLARETRSIATDPSKAGENARLETMFWGEQDPVRQGAEVVETWSKRRRRFQPGQIVVRPADNDESMHLVVSGWACRFRPLVDGRRQITALLTVGDVCGLHMASQGRTVAGLKALTPCEVVSLDRPEVMQALSGHPNIAAVLWGASLRLEMIQEEWLVNLGQRSAHERTCHFLAELAVRQTRSSAGNGVIECEIPLRQTDLSDVLGLSIVHLNRVIQTLRREGMVEINRSLLRILDMQALQQAGGFNASYLQAPLRET